MDEQVFDIRDLVALLRRQARLILIAAALVLAVATVVIFTLKPAYTASVLVLVDPSRKDLLAPEQQMASGASDSARVDSEVEIVKAETTLISVVREAGLLADPEFGLNQGLRDRLLAMLRIAEPLAPSGNAALQEAVSSLRSAVSVQRRGLTYLIVIEARSGNPETAARIANTMAGAYIRQQVEAKIASILAARDIIEGRVADAGAALAAIDDGFAAEIARTQYQTLLARLEDLENQAYLQVADSRVVSRATAPADPSFPNTRLLLVLAGLGALGFGIGLAFLADNFIGGFTSEGQLQALTRARVVSAVPRQKPHKGDVRLSLADILAEAPLSTFSEAIRRIRVGVDRALRRRTGTATDGAVVMVTSAAPGEGKTTTALALARAYAAAGRATLLIDCDLRKPSVHRHLGIERSTGLFDYLGDASGAITLPMILASDTKSAMRAAIGAHRSDIPTDQLISGKAFVRLIEAARQNFDIVLLDTPPLGPVVDGLYLAEHADVVAIVVRWAATSQQEVRSAIAALAEAVRPGVEILAVLNQQDGLKSTIASDYSGDGDDD